MSEKVETFKGTTHIGVVLDKSGSMGAVREETIGGFNAWLDEMKKAEGDVLLTLTLFDTLYVTPVQAAPVSKVNPLDATRYRPDGCTALLDAIGRTVSELEKAGNNGTDRYLICIVTDGQENSSREWTKEKILDLVKNKEAAGNWTFTYLSAHPDAFNDAQSLGVQVGNAQQYSADALGTKMAFRSAATGTRMYAASASMSMDCFFAGNKHANQTDADPADLVGGTVTQQPVASPPVAHNSTSTSWTTDHSSGGGWVSQ